MKIYLDNCCWNRPFDDPSLMRVRLEAEAVLKIQEEIREGRIDMVWSYVLDYENSKNPFQERKRHIQEWRNLSVLIIRTKDKLIEAANQLMTMGIHKFDALHIVCAVDAGCDYFLTTEDKLLKKAAMIEGTFMIDPFGFIKERDL